jgi:hypothetical protein
VEMFNDVKNCPGGEHVMPKPAVKDASGLYEMERRAYHAARSGFRIAELQISPTQKVPWHSHSNVQDTFWGPRKMVIAR